MMHQSRTDFKSEIDPEKATTTFTRKGSDDGQTSRGKDEKVQKKSQEMSQEMDATENLITEINSVG